MSKRFKKLFNNQEDSLSIKFENLKITTSEEVNMAEFARIEAQLAFLAATNEGLQQKITELENNQTVFQNANAVQITEYPDIVPTYPNGDAIQLDAFKVIPEYTVHGDLKFRK